MSKNLKSCIEKLKFIAQIKNPLLRKKLLTQISDNCTYQALHEIAVNTVKGKVKLSNNQKRKLNKYKKLLHALSKPTKDLKKKKKLTIQSGGFLPILIPTVASIITSLING